MIIIMTVKNFRQALGMPSIYRCAKPDHLLSVKKNAANNYSTADMSEAERILLHDAGLVIDLRSHSERDEEQAQAWMSQAPGGSFRIVQDTVSDLLKNDNSGQRQPKKRRTVLRLDPLESSQFMAYLDEHWLSPDQKAKASFYQLLADEERLHNLRMQVLNEKGLIGLNQAILETGKQEMLAGLQAITLHLEHSPDNPVVIHCVQGKDRTGLLVMLCQSILGVGDAEIMDCYHESEARILESSSSSGAATKLQRTGMAKGKLDRKVFMAAPKEVMEATLGWLRDKDGSVSPGYLDFIGFDEEWRDRFKRAMLIAGQGSSRL